MEWAVRRPLPDSLSGFLNPSALSACPNVAALFRATAVSRCLAFRGFPSQKSRALLRTASSLAVAPRTFLVGPSQPFTVGFKQPPIPSWRPLLQEAPPGNPPPPEGLGAPLEASPKRLLSGECCYPPPTMDFLFSSPSAALRPRRTNLPGRPGLGRPESPLGSASLCCEALFLLRVRSNEG
jgi:hypothetical protein